MLPEEAAMDMEEYRKIHKSRGTSYEQQYINSSQAEYKAKALKNLSEDYNIIGVYDDNHTVVDKARSMGYCAYHIDFPNTEVEQ